MDSKPTSSFELGKSSTDEKISGQKGAMKDSFFKSEVRVGEEDDRINFIKKVYSICAAMILFTVFIVSLVFVVDGLHVWMMENLWLHYLCIFITLGIAIALICCKKCARKVPNNYILLFAFTLFESYMVAGICGLYSEAPEIVLMAAVTTLILFLGLTFFACTCKSLKLDLCWALGMGLSLAFFPLILWFILFPSKALYNVICAFGVVIFSIYIVFDTRMIMQVLDLDEYAIGALMIYIDLIQLFLYILQLFGSN
jgi:FtsH-binding integral membrane protein